MYISKEERAQLNALALIGLNDASCCVERLLMDRETVLSVNVFGAIVHITIAPPKPSQALWREAETTRTTDSEISYFNQRFGVSIHWTMPRAEDELQRIATASRGVH